MSDKCLYFIKREQNMKKYFFQAFSIFLNIHKGIKNGKFSKEIDIYYDWQKVNENEDANNWFEA